MSTTQVNVLKKTETLALVETSMVVAGTTEHVHAIATLKEDGPDLNDARYYVSPMVAGIAMDDLSANGKVLSSFSGRSKSEMATYLDKNRK